MCSSKASTSISKRQHTNLLQRSFAILLVHYSMAAHDAFPAHSQCKSLVAANWITYSLHAILHHRLELISKAHGPSMGHLSIDLSVYQYTACACCWFYQNNMFEHMCPDAFRRVAMPSSSCCVSLRIAMVHPASLLNERCLASSDGSLIDNQQMTKGLHSRLRACVSEACTNLVLALAEQCIDNY